MSRAIQHKIKKYTTEDINNETIDDLIETLNEVDVIKFNDKTELGHVYELARGAISFCSQQWRAVEELSSEKESEILGLIEQNDELEKENQELQKALQGSGASQEILNEKKKLTDEVKMFVEETRGLRQKVDSLMREKESLAVEKSELKRKAEALQEENQELSERCQFLQSRFQEKTLLKEPGEIKFRQEISNLRSQIRVQKAKIDTLEDEKQSLWMDIQRLEISLKQATSEIDQASDEHQRMKSALAEADNKVAKKTSECEALRLQLVATTRNTEEADSSNDFIMKTVEKKVDEWKQVLSEKDLEIVQLYEEIRRLRTEINKKGFDKDETSVTLLSKTLKERDDQVQLLKNQLTEATYELEKSEKLLEELRADINQSTGRTADRKLERIHMLQGVLKEKEKLVTDYEQRLRNLDQTIQTQATEITHLENRLKKYESGEYGLAEAINELKSVRAQLDSKERQMEELCRVASQAESARNEISLENEHLRTKLGIALDEPIDLDGYNRMKRAKVEEERAVNEVLQKEIEKLEDERLELKRRLRAAARQLGQKVAGENDHVDNVMMNIWNEGLTEEVTAAKASTNYAALPQKRTVAKGMEGQEPEIYQSRIQVLNAELGQATESIQLERQKQGEYKVRLAQVTEANVCLEAGLREVQAQIKTGEARLRSDAHVSDAQKNKTLKPPQQLAVVECPSLDKLLAALDARVLGEDLDTGRFLKSRVDHLEGANSELRRELREVRLCAAEKDVKLKYTEERLQKLDSQIRALQSISGPLIPIGDKDTQTLPNELDEEASQVIQHLEEHLQSVLNELESKSEQLGQLDRVIEEYRHKFSLCRHRQGLLYQDFYNERQAWKEERKSLELRVSQTETLSNEVEIYKTEMARLTESFSHLKDGEPENGSDEIKCKLADLVREVTVLRVNESALVRRFKAAQDREEMLRKENTGLKSELIQLESAVTARLGYYARYKEKAAFQLANLQETLERSVPRADHERLIHEYEQVAGKYREQMDRRASASATSSTLQSTEAELRKLREKYEALKTQLGVEIERRCWFEMRTGELKERKSTDPDTGSQSQHLSQRVALLEMKELNERERANHAQLMLDAVKGSNQQLESRNAELEARVSQLTKSALDLQTTEQELRQELAEAVPRETYTKTEALLRAAQTENLNLRHEMEQLKEIALISVSQNQTFEEHQSSRDIEAESLRQQLIAVESKDDDRANLARLHRQLTRLQISEATAVRRLAAAQGRATRLENTTLRLEQRLSVVEEERLGQRNRLRQRSNDFGTQSMSSILIKLVQITRESGPQVDKSIPLILLRLRFAGCVPLMEQERAIGRLNSLTEERATLQLQLQEALDNKIACESQLDSMRERLDLGQEVRAVLRDLQKNGTSRTDSGGGGTSRGDHALDKKICEWQSRLADMRLGESVQRRQADKLRQQVHHLETVMHTQEAQLVSLEMENARLAKELDQHELQWEQREAELEEELAALEAGQVSFCMTAKKHNTGYGVLSVKP
ncbi:hypothetical protein FGIG_10446 [Fasciola gigantica]|uniref:Uncharacterized protein n=1 Tax=Fasciola gigantica TaxID=46835 RepID=A0A504YR14_FASGI|nr:hypothetical protein FGIG_10446 [Fasciola gigantica]